MRKDLTVIYYTANVEEDSFEKKIRARLLSVIGKLSLISVSQKPIENFGTNICVGKKPHCDRSALRQLLIGLKKANTKFAIAAESDCLYPPEYFTFVPSDINNVYRYDNTYLLHSWVGPQTKGLYWKKPFSEGAQMCGREYWIKKLEEVLLIKSKKWTDEGCQIVFNTKLNYSWSSNNPVISCKTGNSLRKYSRWGKDEISTNILPYWGLSDKLRKKLFN